MPGGYADDWYGNFRYIADVVSGDDGAGYSNDLYGQAKRIADALDAPAFTYSHDLYSQIRRTADHLGGDGYYSDDIYGQLRRIADTVDSSGAYYPANIFGQLQRISDNAASLVTTDTVLQAYSVWTLLGSISLAEDSARVVGIPAGSSLTMETT